MCLADVAGIARPAIHVLGADPIPDHARSTHQRVGGRGTGTEPQRATRVNRDDLAADVRHPGGADGATPAATEHARTWVISRETADRFTAGTTQAGLGHRQSGLGVVIVLVAEIRFRRPILEADGGGPRARGRDHGARTVLVPFHAQPRQRPPPVGIPVALMGRIRCAAHRAREQRRIGGGRTVGSGNLAVAAATVRVRSGGPALAIRHSRKP